MNWIYDLLFEKSKLVSPKQRCAWGLLVGAVFGIGIALAGGSTPLSCLLGTCGFCFVYLVLSILNI